MTKCWSCKRDLPLTKEFFYTNKGKKNGWGTECKPCRKKYQKARNQEIREMRKKLVIDAGCVCKMCGLYNNNPSFFDLDHIVPVRFTESKTRWFIRDIDNLQVLCPNCHRIKSIEEGFAKRKDE